MSIALSYGTKYIWRHTGTKKSFRLNVCIGHLTATVTALIREQKDTTSHPYFTSCYLLCFWPIPLLQPDPIYRSRKLCVYSMLIAPRTDQSSKSPQFHHYLPWETGWEAHLPTRASQARLRWLKGGTPVHVPVHVRIHWHESVFVTFCKDFLLLSNEFLIKQKLKPQISKLTHVPFCTDLQTWVWWVNFKGAVYATLQMCGFSVPDPKRMSEQKKPNWQWY